MIPRHKEASFTHTGKRDREIVGGRWRDARELRISRNDRDRLAVSRGSENNSRWKAASISWIGVPSVARDAEAAGSVYNKAL